MKTNDTIPDPASNDTDPESAASPGAVDLGAVDRELAADGSTDVVTTDPIWPPHVAPSAAEAPESTAPNEDVDWYLGGFRGRPQIQVKRQAESEGRSGAAYDTLAHPVKRLDVATLPDQPVIVGSQAAAESATGETDLAGVSTERRDVMDDPASPAPPSVAHGRPPRILRTTVPATRRVLAVRRIVNGAAIIATLMAVLTTMVILATHGREASTRPTPAVSVAASPSSTGVVAIATTGTASERSTPPADPVPSAPFVPTPSSVSSPSIPVQARTTSVSTALAVPASVDASSLGSTPPKREPLHKNDGVRNL